MRNNLHLLPTIPRGSYLAQLPVPCKQAQTKDSLNLSTNLSTLSPTRSHRLNMNIITRQRPAKHILYRSPRVFRADVCACFTRTYSHNHCTKEHTNFPAERS